MNQKRKFTVYGNCQASAIAVRLLAQAAFRQEFEYVPLSPCFLISHQEVKDWVRDHLGALDLLICHNLPPGWREGDIAWDIETLRRALKSDGVFLRYPDIYYRGNNPFLTYPKAFARPDYCDYIDLVTLTVTALGFESPELCAAIYGDPSLFTVGEASAISGLAEHALSKRENGLEIQISAQCASLASSATAFHTFNHPSNRVLDFLVASVCERLDIVYEYGEDGEELLGTVHIPHPASFLTTGPIADDHVRLENGQPIPLQTYFSTALAYLNAHSSETVYAELESQTEDPISGIVVAAICRRLASSLSVSPKVLHEIGKLSRQGCTSDFLLSKADPQAIGFMVDILGVLRPLVLPRHMGETLSILDLGAKTAAGSGLLSTLGQPLSFSKVKFDVTCADIDTTFQQYAVAKNLNISYLPANVFTVGRVWDIVICSHVIEHVPDPLEFVEQLRAIAAKHIILAFPFFEDSGSLIPGHVHSLGHDFLRQARVSNFTIYEGLFWSQSFCCIAVIDIQ